MPWARLKPLRVARGLRNWPPKKVWE